MIRFSAIFLMILGQQAMGATECRAPSAVGQVAALIEQTFDGSLISCDDGSSFSSDLGFECRGEKYFTTKNSMSTRPDGSQVYVVTVLSLENDQVKMAELVFPSEAAYMDGEEPTESSLTNFVQLSDKSFIFYSNDMPLANNWLLSTWYLRDGETKARGYKLYADKAVTCHVN